MSSQAYPVILAIESSCDDTGAAVCIDGRIRSNVIASQKVHEGYGGVVPELASRAHIENIVEVVSQCLEIAGVTKQQLSAIAYTRAPGLLGSLLVGAGFAQHLALALNIPTLGIHHMQAHVLSNLIEKPDMAFPFLCLTVSGGHTQLVVCKSPTEMEVIGQTLDDAAGEAFDKIAKLLGLPYPGGPVLDKLASSASPTHAFTEPQVAGLDFSFSGLKTAVLYYLQDQQKRSPDFIQQNLAGLCAAAQQAIVNILLRKLRKAAKQTGLRQICLAGGVSANSGLRQAVLEEGKKSGWDVHIPSMQYCTDNAAMIAITAYHQLQAGLVDFNDLQVSARSSM